MRSQQRRVCSYLEKEWANDGVEILSSGDTSVTAAISQRLEISSLVSDLMTQFNAECDLVLTQTGALILISFCDETERASRPTIGIFPAAVCSLVLYALPVAYSAVIHRVASQINLTNFSFFG